MSKSSSSRSVWSLVLKIVITVATAIGGVFGTQVACNLTRTITLVCSMQYRRKESPFRWRPVDRIISCTVVSVILAIIFTSLVMEILTCVCWSGHTAVIITPIRWVFVMRNWMQTERYAYIGQKGACLLVEELKGSFRKHAGFITGI